MGVLDFIKDVTGNVTSLVIIIITAFVIIYLWIAYNDTAVMALACIGCLGVGCVAGYVAKKKLTGLV